MKTRTKMHYADLMAIASTLWQMNLSRKDTKKELKRLIAKYRADNSRPPRASKKMQKDPFTLYWTIFGPDTPALMPLANGEMLYYELSENTSFPVYISGRQFHVFEESGFESLQVNTLNMVAGALLGCRPPRPGIPLQGADDLRPLLGDYLGRYATSLGYEKLEDLVLEVTGALRDLNGSAASAQALKNSEYLNVNFYRMLNALLLDLWDILGTTEDVGLPRAFHEFYGYLTRVRLEEMHSESIAWYHFARSVTLLFFGVKWPGSVRQNEWEEAVSFNENIKLRERLERLWQEKRFDRRLL